MSKAARRNVLVAGLLLTLVFPQLLLTGQMRKRTVEIEMCDFKMPKEFAQANATFAVIYGLQIGNDGRPTKVENVKTENDFPIPDEPFVSCIKGWTLPLVNHRATVFFRWEHGIGWTQIEITSDDLHYVIKFQPGAFSGYSKGSN